MENNKAVIGFPRWTDKATFTTAGAPAAGYPVDHLAGLPLGQVWRSASLAPADTGFTATLDKPRGVQLVALVGHNLSATATLRLRLYEDAGLTVLAYDSGAVDVWPAVYPYDQLAWEDDNWWDGKYTADEMAGYRWTKPLFLDRQVLARALRVDLADPANPAGFVEAGLCEIAQGWQVARNFAYGAEYGFRFRTQAVEAIGGAKAFDRRDKPRVFRGAIAYAPKDEAFARAFEHQRQADLDTPFLWLPDPTETVHLLRQCFLARNTDPGLLGYAAAGLHKIPLAFEEVL